jgi:peptide/nickel transport system ATP-binding protein
MPDASGFLVLPNRQLRGMHLSPRPLIEARRISIAYITSSEIVRAVRDVSMQIHEGETLALAGETGSGKSTLGLALLGLLDSKSKVESGEILYEGRNLLSLSKRDWQGIRGRNIGIVFQDARGSLNPVLTIKDHLVETLRAHQRISAREALARARDLLQEVGLSKDDEGLFPFELSGGMCQRVAIALAMSNNPRLLIADESTSSLDATIQAQILDLLLHMKQRYGLALLLISHDLALVSKVADRISIMYCGRIVESGLCEEVFVSPAHPYTQGLLQSLAGLQHYHELDPLKPIPGVIPAPGQSFSGCAFSPRCSFSETQCQQSVPAGRKLSNTHWVACVGDFQGKAEDNARCK